jgi:DmsE family decaheme c-type cytochrome
MSTRSIAITAAVLALMFGLPLAGQEAAPPEPQAAEATMSCSDCHEDQVKAFAGNAHAQKGITNAVCESCHGSGTEHIEGGGDKEKITVPKGRAGADKTCLSCHDRSTTSRSHRGGVHANSGAVNCFSCHSIHHAAEGEEHLLVKNELALCATCHSTQTASLRNKPFAHRIGQGGLSCLSCHEAHNRGGRESIRPTAAGELACFNCHTDKRGPHVFPHGAISAGDCMNCHDPHGSANARMLKRANTTQLCLECHSPTTMASAGSQPPSFHNISNARFQNCTTCHVAIHGSNRSPQLLK